jgi:CBS domain-containing protein
MKVKKMMHRNVEWVSPDTPVRTVAKKMRQFDIGAIPVGENDRLIGIVTDRDITVRGVAKGKDVSKLTARDVMSMGVTWCRDTDKAKTAARIMESKRVRRLPVIDANKRMVGMLALGDISHTASQKTTANVTKAVSAHHR